MSISPGTQKQIDSVGGFTRSTPLTSDTFIALYSSSGSGIQARHVTISSGVMTLGAVLTIDAAVNTGFLTICTLAATRALMVYASGSTHNAYVISVSGTTLSKGTVKNLTDTTLIQFPSLDTLSTSAAIYTYSKNSSSDGIARVLTAPATTIAEGAAFAYDSGDSFNSYNGSVAAMSSTKAIVVYANFNDSNRPTGQVLDISGTTITGNINYQLQTTPNRTTIYHQLNAANLDSSRIVVFYNSSPVFTLAFAVSESATVLTPGSLVNISTSGLINDLNIVSLSSSEALAATYLNNATLSVWQLGITGVVVTKISGYGINQGGSNDVWVAALSSGQGALIWEASTEGVSLSVAAAFSGYDLVQGGGLP